MYVDHDKEGKIIILDLSKSEALKLIDLLVMSDTKPDIDFGHKLAKSILNELNAHDNN